MNKLIVGKFNDGTIIRKSTKKEGWGTAMVICKTVKFNNGILNEQKRIGFLRAPLAQLEALGLREGDDLNQKLKSLDHGGAKIVRKESITPFFEGQTPKINPQTEAVVKDAAGNPIFMQDTLVDIASGEEDELVSSAAPVAVTAASEGDDA